MKNKQYLAIMLSIVLFVPANLPVYAADQSESAQEILLVESGEGEQTDEYDSEEKESLEVESENLPEQETKAISNSEEEEPSVTSLEVGDDFTVSRITYIVTGTDPLTVEAYECSLFLTGDLIIPQTVTYNDVTYFVTTIGNGFEKNTKITSITIPEGVTDVADTAFFGFSNVTIIHLPSTLQTFTRAGFEGLETIDLAEGNTAFSVVDGVLFKNNGEDLWLYPSAKVGSKYSIPSSVKTIKEGSFYYNQNLTDIIVPNNVTKIEGYAFDHSKGLKNITIGENVTSFGEYNLYDCDNLETVTLKGNYVIGHHSINNCPKLTTITIDGQVFGFLAYALYNLPSLKEYRVISSDYFRTVDGVLYNGNQLFQYPSAKEGEAYVVPEETTEIASQAFQFMQNTSTVILPPGVKLNAAAFIYPNETTPMNIYFRDTEKVSMEDSTIFSNLTEGSKIYGRNQAVVDSILSYGSAINPEGGATVQIGIIPATGIALDQDEKEMVVGENVLLTASLSPYYSTEEIVWSSSDSNVASVEQGVVTAKFEGIATITAKVGSYTAVCKIKVGKAAVPLEKIELNTSSETLKRGDTKDLSVIYAPSNTTDDKTVTWSTSDAKVAIVENGKVTAKGAGTATITAKVGSKTATCSITVIVPMESIAINETEMSLEEGDSRTLNVTISPSDTTDDKSVTWSTSDSNVATVENGKVTAKGAGTATITAKVGNFTATCKITVTKASVPLEKIALNATSATLKKGETKDLSVTYTPSNTTDDKSVVWSTSDSKVATVENGKVTAKGSGTATITAKVGSFTATCKVTVTVPMESITISETSATIKKGESKTLTVTCNPSDTTDDKSVVWSTSDSKVAIVENGKVTAKGSGTATITAKVGSFTATCKVTVTVPMESITLSETELSMEEGDSKTLSVSISPSDTTDDKSVTWTTSDSKVATVENGKVIAKAAGTATIMAKVGSFTATCKVTVTKASVPLEKIALNATSATLKKGETKYLTVTYTPSNTTDDKSVIWSTSDSKVATVEDGKVIAKGAGTATITAKVGSKTATCKITVTVPLESIALSETELSLKEGDSKNLSVTVSPSDTTDDKNVTWSTSDSKVVTVENGKVIAKATGTATITAKVGSLTATCKVTVTKASVPLEKITLNATSATLKKGETKNLTITYTPSNTTDDKNVIWTTSDSKVATVEKGKVTAKGAGTATITAKVGSFTATCEITVTVPMESITLSETELSLKEGDSKTLNVAISPSDTTDDKSVTWTISDSKVATVENGKVTAKAAGTATITAKVGSFTATCKVTVTKASVPLEKIALNATSATLKKGETKDLSVTYTPSNTTDDKSVTWSTSDSKVATVENGKVTAKGAGTATITAKVGTKTATCKITVTVPLESIALSETELSMKEGDSKNLSVTVNPSDTTDDQSVIWTTSDSKVATVENGKVTAKGAGTATITAKVGSFTATCKVTVTKASVPLEKITLNETSATLKKGETKELTVIYTPSNTTDDKSVTWTTSDSKVATVENGKVTAKGAGTATITAKVGSKTETCKITVTVPMESIALSETELSLKEGDSRNLSVTVNPSDTTDDQSVTWITSDSKVATVENGKVTAKAAGTATITAKVGSKTATCKVTVTKVSVPLEKIALNVTNASLKKGETKELSVTYTPSNTTDDKSVTWTTSDSKVATVENGKVTAKGAGTATITAKVGSFTATCKVTVTVPMESITISETELSLEEGDSRMLNVTISPSDTTDDKSITWTTSDSKVATVENGKVTAKAAGTATITAKVGSKTATCKVTVTASTKVTYQTHVQYYGWQDWKEDGETSGTSGESKRLEGIKIQLTDQEYSGGIQYRTHVQTYGWMDWKENGAMSGTTGESKRLEAIQIQLTGEMAEKYDVYYRVHAQYYGWMGWAKNGATAGTAGYGKRLEAIQIVLVEKGAEAPGSTEGAYRHPMIRYQTHVQTYGWQDWKEDGNISGTSGESKRLEGIKIQLSNQEYSGKIQYRTHVQTYGWQDWKENGAMSGTSGKSKRLEAIQIQLTGEMAEKYDIYYRVHAQYYGWMGWAKNGTSAGTAGYGKRLEAIQIILVEKGGEAPGSTEGAFIEK